MTTVTVVVTLCAIFALVLALPTGLSAQATQTSAQASPATPAPPSTPNPAVTPLAVPLYRELATVALDPARVYHVREGGFDREDIHVSLNEGVIAFSRDVRGHITAAFFEGEGEVLLVPPNQVERGSLALFTGAAVLEEKFSTAYIRFYDDQLPDALSGSLRPLPAAEATTFAEKWAAPARTLAETDALRMVLSLLNSGSSVPPRQPFFHARFRGLRLGNFDLFLDNSFLEQLSAGQVNYGQRGVYQDLWTSFPDRSARQSQTTSGAPEDVLAISAYQIKTRVLPPTDIQSEAVLTLAARRPGYRAFTFELSRHLKVSSVESGGIPLEFIQNEAIPGSEFASRGNDLIAVVFPGALPVGRSIDLHFAYAGPVLADAGGGLIYVGARGTWFPNRGPAMSLYDLEFRCPEAWTLLATGTRVESRTDAAAGDRITRWRSQRPIPIAGFNLGRFISGSARAGDTVVESFAARGMEKSFPVVPGTFTVVVTPPSESESKPGIPAPATVIVPRPPPSPSATVQSVAESSARAITSLTLRLGRFPFPSVDVTQIPGSSSQGWPGLVFLSSYVFLTSEDRDAVIKDPATRLVYEHLMLPHEIAHQWWGDDVFWFSYRDQWIMEALANYSALLTLEEQKSGSKGIASILDYYRGQLLRIVPPGAPVMNAGPVSLGARLTSSRFDRGYETVAYGRGTWLIHMLRHMLRDASVASPSGSGLSSSANPDELFFRIIRNLRERYSGSQLSNRELQAALEAELPPSLRFEDRKSLDWFFEGWVDGIAIPKLDLADVKFSHAQVSGTLLQQEAPDQLVTSVPLYCESVSARPILLGRVFADGGSTEFRLPAPAGCRKLLLDPYNTVLRRP